MKKKQTQWVKVPLVFLTTWALVQASLAPLHTEESPAPLEVALQPCAPLEEDMVSPGTLHLHLQSLIGMK
jgi:hypothetical protein